MRPAPTAWRKAWLRRCRALGVGDGRARALSSTLEFNGGKSQLGRYWEDKFSSRRSSNEKKSTGRSLSGLCSLPCLLLALKAQWQVPETETGHGPHRRSFKVFDKSAKTSQQTSTVCSSGFLEPRTSKIYLLAGPLWRRKVTVASA
eukprot:scaffold6587_cov103-Isochrysis_galbana.AAC.5